MDDDSGIFISMIVVLILLGIVFFLGFATGDQKYLQQKCDQFPKWQYVQAKVPERCVDK